MATLKRAEAPATEHRPLFIAFDKVMRTGKDNGVTLYGVVAKFSDGAEFKFEKDQVTLYDSHFGFKDEEGPLTNPCKTYQNEKGYWDVKPLPAGKRSELFDREVVEVLETPKLAEKKPESDWKPGGGGGKGRKWTPKELEACYYYWLMFMEGHYGKVATGPDDIDNLQALAYAVDGMVEISSMACEPHQFTGEAPAEEKPEQAAVFDDDIPF